MNNFNEVYSMFLIILLVITIGLIIIEYFINKSRKRLRHYLRSENVREHFANIRNKLLYLVTTDKLSSHSATFQINYGICTIIMRRPDRYQRIADELLILVFKKSTQNNNVNNPLEKESEFWSKEVKSIMQEISHGFSKIIIEYSPTLRLLNKVLYWLIQNNFGIRYQLEKLEVKLVKHEASKNNSIKTILQSKDQYVGLAA